ncbi:Fpg/Nei family DNA glycosylase [Corynebacterium sp. ES2794-CONJ1]|uniref:DNA-formamidopyrimidine glycosylase family protein n=1 Tax=unclassified Corynebacterium TaxID=2624378 RepID=UPI0021687252|nr:MULTISPECIES: DNA-formamidopyrimidine glycosylase family protein [unclassified Corynebacterium]MCS4490038.1 Fpg/Nei family DNA glycosylase [Corynebacterium sp. ES2775-CONJ]MCS4491600.1 Fpg/Nei family DNA glycosylase [Corynebacterium sp. ES2715-CONJ3]MCS4531704.1 Fpg/Nei family DNA glycosylase [Corynebacterium sp. ES2730-CONJ]MCU9519100.1 Fpg/Nei family DNA glycosylase [Corynebacterium sp. ES2794-CONJ1]
MPEGDSVFRLARRLQFMSGREVISSDIRVPRFALADFSGRQCEKVWPYGKHLFMAFGPDILQTHLKMEGTWSVHRLGDRWRKPAFTARVVLRLADPPNDPIEIVGHSLGLVRVIKASEYDEAIGYLGPDVLAPEFDAAEAKRRLLLRPDRTIGAALMDQKNLAGVGNEYRAEILFLAGLHPLRRVGDVDIDQVLAITRRLMWSNRLSTTRVSTGVKIPGQTSYVFGRNRKPCRRCGTLIEKGKLGGKDAHGEEGELERIIWWCSQCQPNT